MPTGSGRPPGCPTPMLCQTCLAIGRPAYCLTGHSRVSTPGSGMGRLRAEAPRVTRPGHCPRTIGSAISGGFRTSLLRASNSRPFPYHARRVGAQECGAEPIQRRCIAEDGWSSLPTGWLRLAVWLRRYGRCVDNLEPNPVRPAHGAGSNRSPLTLTPQSKGAGRHFDRDGPDPGSATSNSSRRGPSGLQQMPSEVRR